MVFPATPLDVKVELALGADLSADPASWSWTDITSYVRLADRIRITQGRADESARVAPSTCRLRLDNRTGRFTPRNPLGAYYGSIGRNTPMRVRVNPGSGYVTRFSGFVSSWPPRWDKSTRAASVPIEAAGILRRLQQGTPPVHSPVRRAILASGPVAYWPCEDGVAATSVASAIPDHSAMSISGTVAFTPTTELAFNTDVQLRYGSSSLIDLAAGASLSVSLPGDVATATTSAWTVMTTARVPISASASDVVLLEWTTPGGTYERWRLVWVKASNTTRVIGYDSSGTSTTVIDTGSVSEGFDNWSVSAAQGSGNFDVVFAGAYLNTVAGTLAGVSSIKCNSTSAVVTNDEFPVGHIAVWDATSVPSNVITGTANSYVLEYTYARLGRLCAEDGVSVTIPSVSTSYRTYMGWQPAGTPLDLYHQCVDADMGVLYESGFGLAVLPRESRYNRTVAMALDVDQGHIAEPPEPADDDYGLVNQWRVGRIDGTEAFAKDTDSIADFGLYADSIDINIDVNYEHTLAGRAAWLLHLGTGVEMRWPSIALNLARATDIIDDWLAAGVQSRITVANPPDEVVGDDIDLIVEGYAETLGAYDWTAELNCSPAQPWRVGVYSGASPTDPDRYGAEGSVLNAAVDSDDLALSVRPGDVRWTTDSADFTPHLRLNVGGEVVDVSAVSNAVAFVGVGAAVHGDNSSLSPTKHASTANGNVMLLVAAIRSQTANPNTPSGWGVLAQSQNVYVFSRTANGAAEDAPTVTFTGGVAGDTTSAFIATFAGVRNSTASTAQQSNTSAQNIALPGLTVQEDCCVVFYVGWKQDDYTSATSPGTEIIEASSTTGNDQSLTASYQIQTDRISIQPTSFTITGGVSAVSRGLVLALRGLQTMTVSARSLNGVIKSHADGTEVRLARDAIYAL